MLMMQKTHSLAVRREEGYRPNAVRFDGTNDYLSRGAGLTGAADSPTGVLHCWMKSSTMAEDIQCVLVNADMRFQFLINSSENINFTVWNSAMSRILSYTNTAVIYDGVWHSILLSWKTDLSAGLKLFSAYLDDVVMAGSINDGNIGFSVDLTSTDWSVGAGVGGGAFRYNGDLSQLWFKPGEYLDFSVAANRRKFITSENKPVYLGPNGELPTGSAPIVFLDNPAASYGTNKGTGGNFTVTGALADIDGPG